MAYSFRLKDKSVERGMRRIARSQLDKAIISIDEDGPVTAVHEVRKRCKKVRGLIRLVRPCLEAYADENVYLRDTARLTADFRDVAVMQYTYDSLVERHDAQAERKALATIRRQFALERKRLVESGDVGDRLSDCRARLLKMRKRVNDWSLDADGWDAIGEGITDAYQRARTAAAEARNGAASGQGHELRKRVKYHWMHARLLHRMAPRTMRDRARDLRKLGDLLGDQHNLAIYETRLKIDRALFENGEAVEIMGILARRQRVLLEERAKSLGQRLFAEPPEELEERWHAIWRAWREGAGFNRLQLVEAA